MTEAKCNMRTKGEASILLLLLLEKSLETAIKLKLAFKLNWKIHQLELQECVSCPRGCWNSCRSWYSTTFTHMGSTLLL